MTLSFFHIIVEAFDVASVHLGLWIFIYVQLSLLGSHHSISIKLTARIARMMFFSFSAILPAVWFDAVLGIDVLFHDSVSAEL